MLTELLTIVFTQFLKDFCEIQVLPFATVKILHKTGLLFAASSTVFCVVFPRFTEGVTK
jgi:hypothetical protein